MEHASIDLERLAETFGAPLDWQEEPLALQRLEKIWEGLIRIDRFGHYARQAQLSPLRSTLRDYVLVYRNANLPSDGSGQTACSMSSLKDRFPERFIPSSSLWCSNISFYQESFPEGHWALLDRLYLNCTFEQPKIRLVMYARANDLPAEALRQKSVREDFYDRTVVDAAMETSFFDNCNSFTRTTYQQKDEPAKKQVHVYHRDGQIRISGKRSLPHWRPGKPRWPGVLPAIIFDQQLRD